MRILVLGIAIILFGIAIILAQSFNGTNFGLAVSFVGLIISIAGCYDKDQ